MLPVTWGFAVERLPDRSHHRPLFPGFGSQPGSHGDGLHGGADRATPACRVPVLQTDQVLRGVPFAQELHVEDSAGERLREDRQDIVHPSRGR